MVKCSDWAVFIVKGFGSIVGLIYEARLLLELRFHHLLDVDPGSVHVTQSRNRFLVCFCFYSRKMFLDSNLLTCLSYNLYDSFQSAKLKLDVCTFGATYTFYAHIKYVL